MFIKGEKFNPEEELYSHWKGLKEYSHVTKFFSLKLVTKLIINFGPFIGLNG